VRLTLQTDDVLVADDFLPPATFAALAKDVENGEYRSVHERRWDKAWRLWDGNPLRGPGIYYDPNRTRQVSEAKYPTSTTVDQFFDLVRELTGSFPGLVGREKADWDAIYVSPWVYPVGSALSPHFDGGRYSGAFTYFMHPRWQTNWGGELLLMQDGEAAATRSSGAAAPGTLAAHHAGQSRWLAGDDDESAGSLGIATCVFPWPNRLVLIGPTRQHMIRRVDTNAGTQARISLAGFFLRPVPA
jgi:hypothetical protein